MNTMKTFTKLQHNIGSDVINKTEELIYSSKLKT